MNRSRAFTLIELLVVIAIIAILAAILFPVFAQAKVAAKGAASISNDRQIATACIIYESDYDDRPPLVGITGEPDSPFLLNGTLYKPWAYQLVPYCKNGEIFQDPLTSKEPPVAGAPAWVLWTYRTQFGYAYSVHSPITVLGSPWPIQTTVQTTIAEPSDTVKFLSKKTRQQATDWLWVGGPMWMANLVAPVLCLQEPYTGVEPNSICAPAVRWGDGGYYQGTAPTEIDGLYTGGMAIRKAGLAIVAMSDGHVKAMQPAQVASGTNWTKRTWYTNLRMLDKTKYKWDIE
jgi:prepilin-type N-terminal cleavage/methylation domain-containing protein